MSTEISDLTAATNTSLIPDHILSQLEISDYGAAETEASEQFMRTTRAGMIQLMQSPSGIPTNGDMSALDSLIRTACSTNSAGVFSFLGSGFTNWSRSINGASFLIYRSLLKTDKKMTREIAAGLIDKYPDCLGFVVTMVRAHQKKITALFFPPIPTTETAQNNPA